jgi:hypothetical protein
MKKLVLTLKRIFFKEKGKGTSETQSTYIDGDFVKLVWMIEKLRHPSKKCTMNELIKEANKHFDGLEGIKEVTNATKQNRRLTQPSFSTRVSKENQD